jgi:hypothetical protein
MVKRVTIMLDEKLAQKLREKQAKLIKKTTSFVIFS